LHTTNISCALNKKAKTTPEFKSIIEHVV